MLGCRVLERLQGLQRLSLAGNRLISLPPGVFALPALRELDLSRNCLSALPPEVSQLQSLEVSGFCCPPGLVPAISSPRDNLFEHLFALRSIFDRCSLQRAQEKVSLRLLGVSNAVLRHVNKAVCPHRCCG